MPLNPQMHLAENALDLKSIEQKPTRAGYGEGLLKAGEENPNADGVSISFVI